MKKIIMTAAILGLTASGAMAADQNININANVAAFCTIANASGTTATIDTVAATGLTSGSPTSPTMDVTCNKASTVNLASQNGGVTLGGAVESDLSPVPGFRNRIEYVASVNGGAGPVSLNTSSDTSANGSFNAGAVATTGTAVSITPEASSIPLLAGSYSDVLTLSVNPTP